MSREPITSKRVRRKSHKGPRHGPSVNKYVHLVPKRPDLYNSEDKTHRTLPVTGEPGQTIEAGMRQLFHGRLYELMETVVIPAVSVLPGVHVGMGKFKLVNLPSV